MDQTNMHDPINDIVKQARQGSVAAIIQTLNEQLADSNIRTRAVFSHGVLQLLCEAAAAEQLEQSVLVPRIRQILEGIAPRNIRRVKINSRIVQEQQLLWLEEIMRDPENQLLWSEEITLAKPNIFKQLFLYRKTQSTLSNKKPPLPHKVPPIYTFKRSSYGRGLIFGVSLSCLLIFVGWLLYDRLDLQLHAQILNRSSNSTGQPQPPDTPPATDPFAEAVRLAEEAAAAGKTVQTSAQWLDVAAKWERASDLMSKVKQDDNRYQTAQDRIEVYRKNSELAQMQARKNRS
ncbi:MAG: hypothetical protein F6J86_05495 [Symploca sp. SIO1B1]|nr:hypothetical protein [Symploca sp. SIO1C2]NER46132.1 hypothetical protein [Symploca sp. SIO1A3]NER93279.1 hypothetical protein [Symploca sp. SIO1B1]